VANGDLAGREVSCATVQEGVARAAGGVLDAQVLRRRVIGHVNVADDNWQFEPGCQRATELLVAVRGGAKAMVDVRQTGQREAAIGGELTKDQREGDGIRAA
jgi:hypothetical protein